MYQPTKNLYLTLEVILFFVEGGFEALDQLTSRPFSSLAED